MTDRDDETARKPASGALAISPGQTWLSKRTAVWWRLLSVDGGLVIIAGPKGCVICGVSDEIYRQWPTDVMTRSGFLSWIKKHSAALLSNDSAAAVSGGLLFPRWSRDI